MVFCIGAFSSYFLTSAVLPLVLLCSVLLWFWLGGLQGQAGLAVVSVTQQISAGVNSVFTMDGQRWSKKPATTSHSFPVILTHFAESLPELCHLLL